MLNMRKILYGTYRMNDAIGYIILGLVLVIIIILLVNSANSAAGGGGGGGRRPYGPYYQHGGQGYQPGVLY